MCRFLAVLSVIVSISACSTVTIYPAGIITPSLNDKPDYQASLPYYLFGAVGEHHVDVRQICLTRDVVKMQSQMRWGDGLYTLLTFGIYAPHTASVWCGKG